MPSDPSYTEQRAQAVALFSQHCNCATAPGHPTMPTARSEHLPTCPVAALTALLGLVDRTAGSVGELRADKYVDELRRELGRPKRYA